MTEYKAGKMNRVSHRMRTLLKALGTVAVTTLVAGLLIWLLLLHH